MAKRVRTFNELLRTGGVSPDDVLLVRHKDPSAPRGRPTPYELWTANNGQFELYQSLQVREVFKIGWTLASFVVTPEPGNQTLFVGLWRVTGLGRAPAGTIDPIWLSDAGGIYSYYLERDSRLDHQGGRLVIDWGPGYRTWVQYAARQDKVLLRRIE
jgi:hypothetical protein